ncbi:extracellular solute-binding protein [Streptomyces decoyicus]|uniref:extracellular solute-binding protein n=1 Tax=Streptomyces decoyicus TaxID=249567 RepID=UPI00069FAE61|nr:ABC transporter substrate-binding protein [Streptomyces decoyicus]
MKRPRPAPARRALAVGIAVLVAATAAGGCGYAPAAVTGKAATARSAADLGGMGALVKAAKKEGRLNVYALAPDWANYGEMIKTFERKYGIEVNNENPGGSSQLALGAADKRRGQDRAVDALDLGTAFMRNAQGKRLLAPYKVTGWPGIPRAQKQADGSYLNNYGGYISIGCDAHAVKKCPRTLAELLRPEYRNKVALNGNPAESSSAFSALFAAALANGGSFDDVRPGLEFFKKLKQRGNFVPVESSPATIRKGETPISLDWDYLNLGYRKELTAKGVDWKVTVPSDGQYSQYYNQGINAYAPPPAAARLWLEFLYSPQGQNIWLRGYSRPALLDRMEKDGTADKKAAARLPEVHGTPRFPTPEQEDAAKVAINEGWGKAVG